MKEQVGWSLLSLVLSIWLPIFVISAWVNLEANAIQYQEGFGGNPVGSIGAFLWLIFAAPLTTVASAITGVLGYRQSKRAGRWMAIGSFVITATGVILLMLFVGATQQSATI